MTEASTPWRIAVVTISDKGAAGQREDLSGPALVAALQKLGDIAATLLIPDEYEQIRRSLCDLCDNQAVDLVLTTGGTGLSPRDVTPEATLAVIDRQVPGIPEAVRAASLAITKRAMLSRAVAGIRGRTLIINLPGSPKAALECLAVVHEVLPHALATLTGRSGDCAR
jgi:molybdenum cofactor synthesis domain-containing protein